MVTPELGRIAGVSRGYPEDVPGLVVGAVAAVPGNVVTDIREVGHHGTPEPR